jgi:hypothetical protein
MVRIKFHGFWHVIIIVLLFIISAIIFGDVTTTPLLSGLFAGAKVFDLFGGLGQSSIGQLETASVSIIQWLLIGFLNLVIYYIVSSALILLFNLVFGRGD